MRIKQVTNYAVAVLNRRDRAKAAFHALRVANFPLHLITILGKGYERVDDFGITDPWRQARVRASGLSLRALLFGFTFGCATNWFSRLILAEDTRLVTSILISGVLAALTAFVLAFLLGLLRYRRNVHRYHAEFNQECLESEQYLVVVRGSQVTVNKGWRLLQRFNPKRLSRYNEFKDI